MAFTLRSAAFASEQPIPARFTADGENLSPPLEWQDAPAQTRSFVLVLEDPDAPRGTFRHWGLYNIRRDRTALPEGAGRGAPAEEFGTAVNDFGHLRYDGPDPPPGRPHRYVFRLAALDVARLTLGRNARIAELWSAAQEHVIAEARLTGTYGR